MRLTCPNCGAQYEVPSEVIPQGGRDVQCSNCGVTWFQPHPDHPPAPDAPEEAGWDAEDDPPPEPVDPINEGAPHDAALTGDDTMAANPPETSSNPPRRPLDSAVTEVLRSEAARERAARAAAATGTLETQSDLGLDDRASDDPGRTDPRRDDATPSDADPATRAPLSETERRTAEARMRMSRLRGAGVPQETPPDPPEAAPDPGNRRGLLPNIDEINSSLDSEPKDPGRIETAQAAAEATAPSGFRRGFLTAVLLAVVALLLYVLAPQLVQTVPALEGVMTTYVAGIDIARQWLDGMVSDLLG